MSLWHIILLQSLGLNIVSLPPGIYRWICVLHSTLLLRNTQFMEEHNLYWPSMLFGHFWQSMPMGEKSSEFSPCFGLFLSIRISYACIIGCCIAWWCIIPYINSLKPTHGLQEMPMDKSFKYNSMQPLVHRECHQLPKPHMGAPHVLSISPILVIDDNHFQESLYKELCITMQCNNQ